MTKQKEYQFLCWKCEGIYTTRDKDMPLCRKCQTEHATRLNFLSPKNCRLNIIYLYGKPSPTPLQAAKWKRGTNAKRLIKERQQAIKGED